MNFAHPQYLYLLLLIPLVIGLYVMSRISRRRMIRRMGNPEVLAPLMPMASKYMGPIKLIMSSVALIALVVMIARPRGGETEAAEQRRGIEVMICFDVSRSMLASSTDDTKGISRINRAKFILSKLIDKLDNDRVGLIVFAGNAYTQLPMTNDFSIARIYLNEVSTSMVPTQGTDIGAALRMAINSFSPESDASKAIVLITDSEDHEEAAIEMARQAADSGIQVDVIGIGSSRPTPIPVNISKGEFLKDNEGNIVMTALNDATAKAVAQAGKGIYIDGSAGDAVNQLISHLDELEKSDFGDVKFKASAEQFPWFAWIAFVFIAAEIFILNRKNGWLRKINFFTKQSHDETI